MTPETYQSFTPQPRHAETVEITLDQMLSTEDQKARDAENLAAVREWLHNAYLNT